MGTKLITFISVAPASWTRVEAVCPRGWQAGKGIQSLSGAQAPSGLGCSENWLYTRLQISCTDSERRNRCTPPLTSSLKTLSLFPLCIIYKILEDQSLVQYAKCEHRVDCFCIFWGVWHHQVQHFKDHEQSQLLADGNSSLQCSGSMLSAQRWHETNTNHRSHDFLWRISIKKNIFLIFNPCNLTWPQCKVEQIHTHLAYVGTETFYYPFHNGLPSDSYCPGIRE